MLFSHTLNLSSDDYSDTEKMLKTLAESHRNKVMFVVVDTDEDDNRRVIEFLGLKGEKMPTMRIIQVREKRVYETERVFVCV